MNHNLHKDHYSLSIEFVEPSTNYAASCYVIYMERNDMQLAKAYISVDGGTDTEYIVSTDETLNVLGHPIITRSERSKITYTLLGNCFTAANTVLSDMKISPPVFSLGYSCGTLPFGDGKCSTPLNNPFITDVVSSSYLLPNGLSATHEHQQLLEIFTQGNASNFLNSTIIGGLPLYRQILDNTHKGNVPIDFVELPHTQDVIYITETTIGMINSKGMMLMDLYNPGYCRPIDAILCPVGFFGSVGGICHSCQGDTDTLSVSAQIQCSGLVTNSRRRRLLSSFQSAPYTQMTMVVSNSVQKNDIDLLMKYYMLVHDYNCTDASGMTGYQPYNMAADMQDAKKTTLGKCSQLIPCIIESAANKIQRNLTLSVPEEYIVTWTLQNSSLVNALLRTKKPSFPVDRAQAEKCGLSNSLVDNMEKSNCMLWLSGDFHNDWLPCALGVLNNTNTARRRNLLQVTQANGGNLQLVPQAQGTFVSATSISWGTLSRPNSNQAYSDGNVNNVNAKTNGESQTNIFFIIIVSGVIVGI